MTQEDFFKEVLDNVKSKEVSYVTSFPHVLLDTKELLTTLSLISTIIDLDARRVISRGVSIKIKKDLDKVDIINSNDLYYFSSSLDCENTMEDIALFLDYKFIQKMAKYLPSKTLLFKKEESVYIRLLTGDLELINPLVLETDLKRIELPYNILDKITEVDLAGSEETLNIFSKVLPMAPTAKQRVVNNIDDLFVYSADPNLKAIAPTSFVEMELRGKDINYLYKALKMLPYSKLDIHRVESLYIKRYCFKFNDTLLISNYASAKRDVKLMERYKDIPPLTIIDVDNMLYILNYVMAITYSTGVLSFLVQEDKLVCRIHLTNGNYSTVLVKTKSDVKIAANKTIVLDCKNLLGAMSSFATSLETGIGYKDGILYIINKSITLMLNTK